MPDQQRTKKRLVESCLHLDLRELKQAGLLDGFTRIGTFSWATQPQPHEAGFMLVSHSKGMALGLHDGLIAQRFELEPHLLHRSGVVWKIRCPLCGRRGEKLYMPLESFRFACRDCHHLTYRSAQTHDARINRLMKNIDEAMELLHYQGYRSVRKRLLASRAILTKCSI